MLYGYARVSTTDQNLDRQLEAFKKVSVEEIFCDKVSGKNFERNEYRKLKARLQKGDVVFIKSIDRLGRNYDMIIDEWRDITQNIKADIVVIDMPLLDTRDKEKGLTGKFISDLVLQILSYVAEVERNNIKQRQAEGIKLAREKGIHLGRPKSSIPDNFNEIARKWQIKEITISDALAVTNMKKSRFYKLAKENGFPSHKLNLNQERCGYFLTSEFSSKCYAKKKELLNDLKISNATLNKYLNGGNTVINKLGIIVKKMKYGGKDERNRT